MLLRFLGIATLSVTVLTVKAMGSTEAHIPTPETPDEIFYEIVYTAPVIRQTAALSRHDDDPAFTGAVNKGYMPASHDRGIREPHTNKRKQIASYKRTPPLPVRLRSNADDVKGGIAGLLGRKLNAKKQFVRHAYLPPSHKFETTVVETATDAGPTNILASLEQNAPAIKQKEQIAEEVEALIEPETEAKETKAKETEASDTEATEAKANERKAKAARAALKKRLNKSKRATRLKLKKRRKMARQKKQYRKNKYAAAKKYKRKRAQKYRTDYLAAFN